eukprot:9898224-Ditylum_brightwellii.AAC.1
MSSKNNIVVNISGMSCGSCVKTISNALTAMGDNVTASVDLGSHSATVSGPTHIVTFDSVVSAIEGVGFGASACGSGNNVGGGGGGGRCSAGSECTCGDQCECGSNCSCTGCSGSCGSTATAAAAACAAKAKGTCTCGDNCLCGDNCTCSGCPGNK